MKRWPTLAGLSFLFALTQAWAGETSPAPSSAAKPHGAKTRTVKSAGLASGSLGDIAFSNPYAPPIGSSKLKGADFPVPERTLPTEDESGFSIRAGRDGPGAPMTGGLKFRF